MVSNSIAKALQLRLLYTTASKCNLYSTVFLSSFFLVSRVRDELLLMYFQTLWISYAACTCWPTLWEKYIKVFSQTRFCEIDYYKLILWINISKGGAKCIIKWQWDFYKMLGYFIEQNGLGNFLFVAGHLNVMCPQKWLTFCRSHFQTFSFNWIFISIEIVWNLFVTI